MHRNLAAPLFAAVLALTIAWLTPHAAAATVGFDRDDFVVAGWTNGRIAVYDSDFTFKGYLDENFPKVAGLDFDAEGNLVAVGGDYNAQEQQVRVYDKTGNLLSSRSFGNIDIGVPIDVKVGPNGNYYVGAQSLSRGLMEFTPDGQTGRQFDTGRYLATAVLPGNVLWAGGVTVPSDSPPLPGGIHVFDLVTGDKTATLAFDNGQNGATSMYYSPATNTVLIADGVGSPDAIVERALDGTFIRKFNTSQSPYLSYPLGVTRGPNGEVFATDSAWNGVFRWSADGAFLGLTDLSSHVSSPGGILWTGNAIPEPASLLVLAMGGLALLGRRARLRSAGR